MKHTYSFEKLEVWKKSRLLNKELYVLTQEFPTEQKYGLTSQLRRCAISISSNIAEGSGRVTYKDKAHFTSMAYSSLMELLNQLILAMDMEYITPSELDQFRARIDKVSKLLSALRKYQLSKV